MSYKTDLKQFDTFLKDNYDSVPIKDAKHALIRNWIVRLSEGKLDARSINRKMASLRSYFKYLMKQEVISESPMLKVKVLKSKKKLPHFVNEGDMNLILDNGIFENNFKGRREQLILELFYGTGMRLSELINLEESKINFKERTLKVLGKRNKERVIPFHDSLVQLIEAYIKERNKELLIKNHGKLLVTDSGEQLYPMMVNRIVKRYLQTSSVEKKSPHVLRHTYATHLLNKGAEINAVKDLLGHSSLAATQVYTHNTIEKLKKTFDQSHPKA